MKLLLIEIMKMNTLIGLLLFALSFGGGAYLGNSHQKKRNDKEMQNILIEHNNILVKQGLKIDSLMQLPEKVDTIIEIQKEIVYKTDTLILLNKNIMLNTDTIKNELRLHIRDMKCD